MLYTDLSSKADYSGNPMTFEIASRYLMADDRFDETLFNWSRPMKPSVIIGGNQNIYSELNLDYIKAHDIQIARRAGGGGAVYVDSGNLTYSFIDTDDGTNYMNFKKYATPVINVLKRLGVDAELSGRNDLTVDGKKFSGMATFKAGSRFYVGGTLMIDVDLDAAAKALNPPKSKLASKGVQSVHSRVTNLRPYFSDQYKDISIEDILGMILKEIFQVDDLADVPTYRFDSQDWDKIEAMRQRDYPGDDWIMGKQFHDNYFHSNHFDNVGNVEISFSVNNGIVTHAKIFGDFNKANGNLAEIEDRITGVPFERDNLIEAFENSHLADNIGNVTPAELAELMVNPDFEDIGQNK